MKSLNLVGIGEPLTTVDNTRVFGIIRGASNIQYHHVACNESKQYNIGQLTENLGEYILIPIQISAKFDREVEKVVFNIHNNCLIYNIIANGLDSTNIPIASQIYENNEDFLENENEICRGLVLNNIKNTRKNFTIEATLYEPISFHIGETFIDIEWNHDIKLELDHMLDDITFCSKNNP